MSVRAHLARENRAHLEALAGAVRALDHEAFERGFEALHVFAHDDAELHAALHRLQLERARRMGSARGVLASLAPVAFAGLVSRLESAGPAYEAEAFIAAPRAHVFEVLTDFGRYAEWNPWLVSASGDARVGASVRARVRLGSTERDVDHVVEVVVPGARLAWRDAGWFTPLARGRRLRSLVDEGDGTRLRMRLTVTGPLAGLVHLLHGDELASGLAAETAALVAHAASHAATDTHGRLHGSV